MVGHNIVIFRSSHALDVFPKDTSYFNFLNRLPNVDSVYFYDFDNMFDIIEKFNFITLDDNSIFHFVIQAHGSPDSIILGEDKITIDSNEWEIFIDFFKGYVNQKMSNDGTIFLHACSVAKGKQSLARLLSIYENNHVIYGATDDITMNELQLEFNHGIIEYNVIDEKKRPEYYIASMLNGVDIGQIYQDEYYQI
ncbi:MAG: hypothetical protein KAS12_01360 [Candidatus Aenigmarchaeota archaeon]|nr:hypothetical protein [Candidatus Aenigmarchaeota archaeon]